MLCSASAQDTYGRMARSGVTNKNVPVLFRVGAMFQRTTPFAGSICVTVVAPCLVGGAPAKASVPGSNVACNRLVVGVVTRAGQEHPGSPVDDEVFIFLGVPATDVGEVPTVLLVGFIGHVRPVSCQPVFPFRKGVGHHKLLLDDIRAIFHGDCGPTVLEALNAVAVRSDPVRHVGGILV